MEHYIERQLNLFKESYNAVGKEQQSLILQWYVGDLVGNILGEVHGREYCEMLAKNLIEHGKIRVGWELFEQVVDGIEAFFESKKEDLYPQWQRNFLAFLLRKGRESKTHKTSHQ